MIYCVVIELQGRIGKRDKQFSQHVEIVRYLQFKLSKHSSYCLGCPRAFASLNIATRESRVSSPVGMI